MHIKVLMDNTALEGYKKEWGSSFLVETEAGRYLIDTGASLGFAVNASRMGSDLSKVDRLFLSHPHYDHGNGIPAFSWFNHTAPIHIAEPGLHERCYSQHRYHKAYIGLRRWIPGFYADRFLAETSEDICIRTGVGEPTAIPHFLEPSSRTASMWIKTPKGFVPDCFDHEQTIVFRTEQGLVVFSPCSHLGVTSIIREVEIVFPEEPIRALVGGLHLFRLSEEEIYPIAWELRSLGVEEFYVGHCTGDLGCEVLEAVFGDRVHRLSAGMDIEL